MEKILFRYGSKIYSFKKQDLLQFVIKSRHKTTNLDAYDYILKFLDRIWCIQVYQDLAVRLHLKPYNSFIDIEEFCKAYNQWSDFITESSLFINNLGVNHEPIVNKMIQDLISISEN